MATRKASGPKFEQELVKALLAGVDVMEQNEYEYAHTAIDIADRAISVARIIARRLESEE